LLALHLSKVPLGLQTPPKLNLQEDDPSDGTEGDPNLPDQEEDVRTRRHHHREEYRLLLKTLDREIERLKQNVRADLLDYLMKQETHLL
ncbi:E4, partial [Morelia spilota papillomavirus 1]